MAADTARTAPSFVASIQSAEDVTAVLSIVHPDYAARKQAWEVLLDAFEGSGGFLDGSYLWPHPREEQADFEKRQAMARYHNYVESLVDLFSRFIFTQGVKRESNDVGYNAFTEDVDGAGTPLSDLLRRGLSIGLVSGHAGILIDKTTDEPTDQTKAGEKARPVATVFTALAIPDWRFDRHQLVAVKLIEAAPEPSLAQEVSTDETALQYLFWDGEGWARFNSQGDLIAADTPDLGMVPLVILRPKPSYSSPMLGRPLISNANVVRAMFNRASEEDEVLRSQAFSVLTVSVPENGNVDNAKRDLGTRLGTSTAIVVQGQVDYKTPDQSVPGAIRENISYLVRELYRAACIRYENDARAAESGESIRLQFSELNELLQGIAKGLSVAEKQIARAYFAWTSATPEAAQAAFDAAQVTAEYPDEFFLDALLTDLEAWAEAVRMNLGPSMTKRIKKRAVRRIEPDMPAEDLEVIDKEIDAMKDEELAPPTVLDRGDPEGQMIAEADRGE